MKNATHCPRCECQVFYRIDKLQTPGIDDRRSREVGMTGRWVNRRDPERHVVRPVRLFVGIEAWVCRDCGYAELYASDLEQLAAVAEIEDSVTVVDRSSGDGPFR